MKYVRLHMKWICAFGGVRLGLICIKQKNRISWNFSLFNFFQRWQAVCFTGNSHGCFLQSACFRVCPNNQGSQLYSPGPSIKDVSGEGHNWQRETKTSYKIVALARIHLAKSSMCFSRFTLQGVSHSHWSLDSWGTTYFKLIIHVSLQSKLSTAF